MKSSQDSSLPGPIAFPPYLISYACLTCRKAFKRHNDPDALTMACPECGGSAHRTSRKFKPPRRTDVRQWEKVRFLLEHGFRFFSVRDSDGKYVQYPKTLEEARTFVELYRRQARAPIEEE